MDFEWTTKQRETRDRVAVYLDEAERARLRAAEDEDAAGLREITLHVQRRLVEAGALGISASTSSEKATLARLAVDLELARTSASFLLAVQATRQFAGLMAEHGSERLLAEVLGPLHAGERIGAVALPDPGGSVDGTPAATLQEDGSWRIRGKRSWVANAPIADRLAVFVADGARTLIAIVRRDQPGVRVGKRLRLVGLDGLVTSAVHLDDAPVPAYAMLGPFEDSAVECRARRTRDLALAAASVGRMHAAWAAAKTHAETHRRGGKPLVARQEVGFRLAELLALAQTAEWMLCRAAWMAGEGDEEADVLVRCAKVFCSETGERVTSGAMSVLAGHGCVTGNVVERAWRDAKALAAMGSTVETARMAIAESLLERV